MRGGIVGGQDASGAECCGFPDHVERGCSVERAVRRRGGLDDCADEEFKNFFVCDSEGKPGSLRNLLLLTSSVDGDKGRVQDLVESGL